MKIRCLAIDDEPLALGQLVAYIDKIPYLELVGKFSSALDALEYLEKETVDAIFCDINMPDMNGVDFVKSLAVPPLVVFTTAYSEYAVDGFRVNAVDYLLKPFSLQEFQRAAIKLKDRMYASFQQHDQFQDMIFLKSDRRVIRVDISQIQYIEGMSEYLKVWMNGETKPIITLLSIKKIEECLPNYFIRIHRSYIVNSRMIREVERNRIITKSGASFPIGDIYKDAFREYLNMMLVDK